MSHTNPELIHRRFEQYINEQKLQSLVSLYEEEAVLIDRDGRTLVGRAAVGDHLGGLLAMKPHMSIIARKKIIAGEIAVLVADWTLELTDSEGKPIHDGGRTYDVLIRQPDGSWRIAVDNPWNVSPQ